MTTSLRQVKNRPYVQAAINEAKDTTQSTLIDNLRGVGSLPAGLANVVTGCYPLFHTVADAHARCVTPATRWSLSCH